MGVNEVLKKKLSEIKLSDGDEKEIMKHAILFTSRLEKSLKNVRGKIFLGGSFAKGTAVKKKIYDVDIFALFPRDSKDISSLLEKALKKMKVKAEKLPGSRDYFGVKVKKGNLRFRIEIVPVVDIKNSKEALNVTDVSPLHVKYIKSQTRKNKKLADDIRLMKSFCYGQDCYGAESHIRGFSGYCLEVLTAYYGGFTKFLRAASKWPVNKRIVLDPKRYYKNKNIILEELNEAKLLSPLVLIDPVQRERNVAAALNQEKLEVFVKACKNFLKSPSIKYFERKEINEDALINESKKKRYMLFRVDSVSERVKEDISGAKLLKLHNLLKVELSKESYGFKDLWAFEENHANSYFMITKNPKVVILHGPPVKLEVHAKAFKKKWKNYYIKNKKLFVKRKIKAVREVLKLEKRKLNEMGISSFKISEWC